MISDFSPSGAQDHLNFSDPSMPPDFDEFLDQLLAEPERYSGSRAKSVAHGLHALAPREAIELLSEMGLEPQVMAQYLPLSIVLGGSRRRGGYGLREVANALATRQKYLRAIENSVALGAPRELPARYAVWLGLQDWYARWLAVNPELTPYCAALDEGPLSMGATAKSNSKAKVKSSNTSQAKAPKLGKPDALSATDPVPAGKVGRDLGLVWQIKVTLRDVQPTVWRRFWISERATLAQLHDALQIIMGWQNCHLHEFHIKGLEFDMEDIEEAHRQQTRIRLSDLGLKVKARFGYTYDFGDSWEHDLVLEKTLPRQSPQSQPLPWCLEGAQACPPEDSGGPWGHAEHLEALRNRKHPEHAEIKEWIGDYDPDHFDTWEINGALHPKRKFWLPNR